VIDNQRVGWDQKVHSVVKEIQPEVVHIQHEFGLYETQNDYATGLFRPLFRWKIEEKFPVVVTYHSVYSTLNKMMASYLDVILRLTDAGIVHEVYQWSNLPVNLQRMVDNVYVIPHGARSQVSITNRDAKKSLGLEGKKTIGMLGWFTPTKGFDRVIAVWDELSNELGPDTFLVLAGDARRGDPLQKEYKQKLLTLIERCRKKERVKVVWGSFSPQEYEKLLASFDVMVMPYTFASQSGNLAHSLALGAPVVVSGIEGLRAEVEASGAGIAVTPQDDEELKSAISILIRNNALREKYSRKATRYVKEKISWSIVAEKHMRLYRKLLNEKQKKKEDIRSVAMLES
jgi:1,2-diacylglycerol 3-alpha-glucosyltransferase